jgi:hypothetical protein
MGASHPMAAIVSNLKFIKNPARFGAFCKVAFAKSKKMTMQSL